MIRLKERGEVNPFKIDNLEIKAAIKYVELVFLKENSSYNLFAISQEDGVEIVRSGGPIKAINVKFQKDTRFHIFL